MVIHCSQGHQNPDDSRFCHLCGEKLMAASSGIYGGMVLVDRYRIIRELGQGGFGRTYLVEDLNRFNEYCVLKEFAPQVQGTYALQKSQELFEREAGVLYQLQHPQIPRFRELFQANFNHHGHLFLVQDYVAGKTYRQWLDDRIQQGTHFTEAEVTQLLRQLLPVLHYIHLVGVIHRDIAPDNLIHRETDQLPVLIDFGGVKQVAAAIVSQFGQSGQPHAVTRLGKVGYAPPEQMQTGRVYPYSDLYALAATVLVLLTGKEPQELVDPAIHPPRWQRLIQISSTLESVLARMLAPEPGDRFQSAAAVLEALNRSSINSQPLVPAATNGYVAPVPSASNPTPVFSATDPLSFLPPPAQPVVHPSSTPSPPQRRRRKSGVALILLLFVLGSIAAVLWWTRAEWQPLLSGALTGGQATNPNTSSANFSRDEQRRKEALGDRRQQLGIDGDFLIILTDDSFKRRYPELQGRSLTTDPSDAEWRARWDGIAAEWLDQLETHLSAQERQHLGRYGSSDRQGWVRQVNQRFVGSRALYDLTDARFFRLFPEARQWQDFLTRPIGQVWHAIAAHTVQSIQDGTVLDRLRFPPGKFSQEVNGTLEPGSGKIYVANLSAGQILRINLQSPQRSTFLSIYVPNPSEALPFYLEDSRKTTWSGRLEQSGYYEIVVVSTAPAPITYRLNVAVDNVTSIPVEPATPESPEAKQ